MRVLLEGLQAGNRSGTGIYTQQLIRWLPRVAADLELTVLWPEGTALPPPEERGDVDFEPIRESRWGRLTASQWRSGRGVRNRQHWDVTHYPATVGSVLGAQGMVITVHDLSFLRHGEWFRADRALYYRWAVRHSAPKARRIIADSEATAGDLRELLNIPEDRIDVVPLGVGEGFQPASEDAKEQVREKYNLPERYLLYMGTLEPRKNLVRLVEAWSRVAHQLPQDLVLAGRRGWKVGPLLRAVLKSPCNERIYLPGYIDPEDQAAVLSAAEGFIWPSLYEGFGLPPLEAMACGVPVMASHTSSLPEAVGDAALLVDPVDVEAIAVGICLVAQDESLRERLRTAGLARASQFTWRRTAEMCVGVYRKAAEG